MMICEISQGGLLNLQLQNFCKLFLHDRIVAECVIRNEEKNYIDDHKW